MSRGGDACGGVFDAMCADARGVCRVIFVATNVSHWGLCGGGRSGKGAAATASVSLSSV